MGLREGAGTLGVIIAARGDLVNELARDVNRASDEGQVEERCQNAEHNAQDCRRAHQEEEERKRIDRACRRRGAAARSGVHRVLRVRVHGHEEAGHAVGKARACDYRWMDSRLLDGWSDRWLLQAILGLRALGRFSLDQTHPSRRKDG